MSSATARRLSWVLWWIAVALFAGGMLIHVFEPASRDPALPPEHSTLTIVTFLLYALAFPALGVLIAVRFPAHPVGWLVSAAGICELLRNFSGYLARLWLIAHPGTVPLGDEMLWVSHQSSGLFVVLLTLVFLLFPDGRVPSPRWRPLAVLIVALGALRFVIGIRAAWELDGFLNPYAVEPGGEFLRVAGRLLALVSLAVVALSGVSLIARYRRARERERLQIKWVGVGVLVATITLVAFQLSGAWTWAATLGSAEMPVVVVYGFGVFALPVTLAIAMLRHHLYDIDVLINRTLVYGVTVVTLGVLYIVAIVASQAALRPFTQGDEVPVALATLGAIALFAPIRARVQRAVDRRFYRSRYDAARTLDSLALRLRDEVDIDALRAELLGAVRDTMQPVHASLWLRERPR